MSRIGKKEIAIPQGVTVVVDNGQLKVTGPKGTLERPVHRAVTISVDGEIVRVDVQRKEDKNERSLWGTFASHVINMITGVTEGFKKQLEVNGVGYRVAMKGTDLNIEVGYSHPVEFKIPDGLTASVDKNIITIEGMDKELVGQIASEIRAIRKPEPYKGKGIKYIDEVIQRKAGKAAKAAGA